MSRPSFSKRGRKPFQNQQTRLNVETLENRLVPTASTISGFVYYDLNANGLKDPGEAPIANSSIELRTLTGTVVGSTTTNAEGYYEFTKDDSVPKIDGTSTDTFTFAQTQTNFELPGQLKTFDTSLGELQSVEITHAGSITSEIKVENVSVDSPSLITGTVSGNLKLVAPSVNDTLSISAAAGTFDATKYDGKTDFDDAGHGTSGGSLGAHTADGTKTITLTGSDINAYKGDGTSTVAISESAVATSHAEGGGNVDVRVRSSGQSTVTVVYHYKKAPPLAPGSYKVVQTIQPDGFTDGSESKDGSVIPNTIGTDFIVVGLLDHDLPNNNFGELKPTGISGHVWHDANNDGVRDASEDPIAGTSITLVTPNGTKQTTTNASGYYEFTNLEAGTYTLKETQPTGYLDGKDKEGTKGGTVVNDPAQDQIKEITLTLGDRSENNDFGELKPASIAGKVYVDTNKDGNWDSGEPAIPNTKVTLTGFDDQGPVSKELFTDQAGKYKFSDLRPGTYAVTETQPTGFDDGGDTIGTVGGVQRGTPGNDVHSDVTLAASEDGIEYNFGEIRQLTLPKPLPKDTPPLAGVLYIIPTNVKLHLLGYPVDEAIDPGLRSQMAFVVGASVTLTGHNPDAAETKAAVDQLNAGMTAQQYIAGLANTDAHRAIQATNVYEALLDRAPSASELSDAIATLKTSGGDIALSEKLFVSTEYAQVGSPGTELEFAL